MSPIDHTPAERRSFARSIVLIFCVNSGSALAVVALNWLLSVGATNRWLVGVLTTSLVYANCCGTLMGLIVPRVAPRIAKQPFPLNWIYFIGTLLMLSAIGSWLAVLILTRLGIFPREHYWAYFRSTLVVAIAISLLIGVTRYLYEGLKHRLAVTTRQLQMKELDEERARKLAVEARLSSLESRIHPHFLFNTLNSISSLIQEDPKLAERLVERLAALLRFSLDSNESRMVPLSRELKIVIDYLEIERARFGDKLRYSIEVPPELYGVEVPPLAVQTLVENSLKHAVAARREGGEVFVTACADGGRLNIEVRDDGSGFDVGSIQAGHGLENLQSRLTALFDGAASLNFSRLDGYTAVTICLPYVEALTSASV
jgi:sensor histidine kinase YesM